MSFPAWTLWGMGLASVGALFFLLLALIAQSPGLARRVGLRYLVRRGRAMSGYAFACLLLVLGFFLAGVPVGRQPAVAGSGPTPQPSSSREATDVPTPEETEAPGRPPATPATGAFGGPPAPDAVLTASGPLAGTGSATAEGGPAGTATDEPAPPTQTRTPAPSSTPSPTDTPTPTATPLPSITPTSVSGETAVVSVAAGAAWIKRAPGGENLVLLQNGATVLLLPGHASYAGDLWREVSSLEGISGWMRADYLTT
ncbi:MAG: hypothetical protein ACRDHL_09310 [Candidatus Promineifilaceae bacterium]